MLKKIPNTSDLQFSVKMFFSVEGNLSSWFVESTSLISVTSEVYEDALLSCLELPPQFQPLIKAYFS